MRMSVLGTRHLLSFSRIGQLGHNSVNKFRELRGNATQTCPEPLRNNTAVLLVEALPSDDLVRLPGSLFATFLSRRPVGADVEAAECRAALAVARSASPGFVSCETCTTRKLLELAVGN